MTRSRCSTYMKPNHPPDLGRPSTTLGERLLKSLDGSPVTCAYRTMSDHDHLENFYSWFVEVLEQLYPIRAAGFAITMIAFPLLERYLRQKTNLTSEGSRLTPAFYGELLKLFPELRTQDQAELFWRVYRNGILHQVAFSQKTSALPAGALSHTDTGISITPEGDFRLNPTDFAKRITAQILADFPAYEGAGSSAPTLAVEWVEAIKWAGEVGATAGAPPGEYVTVPSCEASSKVTRTHPEFQLVLRTSTRSPPK
jgi:hypothetical protein